MDVSKIREILGDKASLLEHQSGRFALVDGEHRLSAGVTEHATERLVARSVVRAGAVVACDEPT